MRRGERMVDRRRSGRRPRRARASGKSTTQRKRSAPARHAPEPLSQTRTRSCDRMAAARAAGSASRTSRSPVASFPRRREALALRVAEELDGRRLPAVGPDADPRETAGPLAVANATRSSSSRRDSARRRPARASPRTAVARRQRVARRRGSPCPRSTTEKSASSSSTRRSGRSVAVAQHRVGVRHHRERPRRRAPAHRR